MGDSVFAYLVSSFGLGVYGRSFILFLNYGVNNILDNDILYGVNDIFRRTLALFKTVGFVFCIVLLDCGKLEYLLVKVVSDLDSLEFLNGSLSFTDLVLVCFEYLGRVLLKLCVCILRLTDDLSSNILVVYGNRICGVVYIVEGLSVFVVKRLYLFKRNGFFAAMYAFTEA